MGIQSYDDHWKCWWYSEADGDHPLQHATITFEQSQACIEAVRPLLQDSGACGS